VIKVVQVPIRVVREEDIMAMSLTEWDRCFDERGHPLPWVVLDLKSGDRSGGYSLGEVLRQQEMRS